MISALTNRFCILVILALIQCSCSSISKSNELSGKNKATILDEVSTPDSPLILRVQKINSNKSGTTIWTEVQARTDWDISKVTLNFSLFKEGNLVEAIVKNLSEFNTAANKNALKAGDSIQSRIESPAADISDYQLALGWGDEAEVIIKRSVEINAVKLVNLGADAECSTYVCDHFFAVEALLHNDGTEPISKLELDLKLKDLSSGQLVVEQTITLDPVNIAVGAKQMIRLKINQGFPSAFGQQIQALLESVAVN